MVNRDIIITKIANIQKSLDRLKEKQKITAERFSTDRDIQDIVLLNLQTAIQGCIDIASHIVSDNNWGIPGSIAGLFDILYEKKALTKKTMEIMRSMVGLRNIIVHEYEKIDMNKIYDIFAKEIKDFHLFLKEITIYTKI